nr:tetratricopeptide repeat protein [uncultured Desulfobulbus sp.]
MKKTGLRLTSVLLAGALMLSGCSSPEEKMQVFINKGNVLYQQGDYVKAVLEYRNAIAIDPGQPENYYLAGQAYLKQRKIQEAYGFFMKTVEKQADHIGANIQLGKLYLGAREFAKAKERAVVVLGKEPANQDAFLLQAAILLAEKKPADTKNILEKVLAHGAKDVDLVLLLAAANGQLGDQVGREKVLLKGAEENPKSIPIQVTLANYYLEHKDAAKVEQVLKYIISLEPEKTEHVERLAAFQWHQGNTAEADALLQGILAKNDGNEDSWTKVAAFYLTRKAVDQGQDVLQKGLERLPKSFRLRFLLKEAYLLQGNFVKAVATLEECLQLDKEDPAYVTAQRGLAELYLRAGNIGQADGYVQAVLKNSPNDVEAHQLNGSILLQKGELEQAIAEFRTVLQAKPRETAVYAKMADAFVRNRQNNLAVDTLKQGMSVNPKAGELHFSLAKLYVLMQQPKDAEEELQQWVQVEPDNGAAAIALADFYVANKERDKAISLYQGVLKKQPGNTGVATRLMTLYMADQQWNGALDVLKNGLAADPGNNGLLEQGVRQLVRANRTDDALRFVQARIDKNADDGFAYILLGEVQSAKKNYGAAEEAFRKVMALNGAVPDIGSRLARILVQQGKAEQGIAETLPLVDKGGSIAQNVLLAELYKQTGHPQEGLQVYAKALEKFPENWFLLNNVAYSIAEQQNPSKEDLEKAANLAGKAQIQSPGNPAVMDTMGWIAFKQGQLGEARAALTTALGSNTANPVFSYHLAMVLMGEKKLDEAKSLLENVVRAPGDFKERELAQELLKSLAK